MSMWKRKFLSKGGRLVLIKSVISSMPAYLMSVCRIPVGVAKSVEKLQRSFYWGDKVEKRKIHAVGWESMCKSKKFGGLGIGRISDKNKSLLAKWVWRFGKESDSLWKRVLCAKYGVSSKAIWWNWDQRSSVSAFVKAVGGLLKGGSDSARVLKDGWKVILGCGNRARF